MRRYLLLLSGFFISAALFGAATTKVGGSGATKVGGSGATQVQATAAAAGATFSDDFNRANGVLTSPWVDGPGASFDLTISSNKVVANSGGQDCFAVVSTPTFAANQKATVVLSTFPSGSDPGVILHGNTSNANCFFVCYSFSNTRFESYKIVDSGSLGYTNMGNSSTITPTAGDTLSFEVTGNTYTAKHNGAQVLTFNDSTYTSGQPGIRIYSTTASVDDFSATDI